MAVVTYEHPDALVDPEKRVSIIKEDYRLIMPVVPIADVVLTDPPYVWYKGLVNLYRDAGEPSPTTVPTVWPVYSWLAQWVPLLLCRVKHAIWLTADWRYRTFYRHFLPPHLHLHEWPLEHGEEAETALYCITPRAEPFALPPEALALYRYGVDSPVAFWAALLALMPYPHDLLLDPFCGTGSGLIAGVAAGYRVVGIEHDAATFARLHARMEALVE